MKMELDILIVLKHITMKNILEKLLLKFWKVVEKEKSYLLLPNLYPQVVKIKVLLKNLKLV